MTTITRPISRLIYRSIRPQTHLGRQIDRHLTDMSTDILADTRPLCRPIHWSSVGRYVDRDVDRYIGRGVHKIHMIRGNNKFCSEVCGRYGQFWPWYQLLCNLLLPACCCFNNILANFLCKRWLCMHFMHSSSTHESYMYDAVSGHCYALAWFCDLGCQVTPLFLIGHFLIFSIFLKEKH